MDCFCKFFNKTVFCWSGAKWTIGIWSGWWEITIENVLQILNSPPLPEDNIKASAWQTWIPFLYLFDVSPKSASLLRRLLSLFFHGCHQRTFIFTWNSGRLPPHWLICILSRGLFFHLNWGIGIKQYSVKMDYISFLLQVKYIIFEKRS